MDDRSGITPQAIVEALDAPSILLDRDGLVIAVNDAFLDRIAAFDAYRETLVGYTIDALRESIDDTALEPLQRAIDAWALRLPGVAVWRKGGQERAQYDIRIAPVGDGAVLVRFVPIDDAAKLMQELRRVRRLECIGAVAAGVAHDLNNQLGAVLNLASLLRGELGKGSRHQSELEIVEGAATRAADLARRLLGFAGRGQPEIQETALREVVERTALLLRHELPKPERLHFDFSGDPGPIQGDPAQLDQIVALLLLRLARGLAPDATATVSTLRVEGGAVAIGGRRLAAPAYAAIRFELPRLPADANASDEVLAAVDSIAADHGGGLEVGGTAERSVLLVRIGLPARAQASPPSPSPSAPATAAGKPSATAPSPLVMIVDDDPMVRSVATALVRRLGYRTLPVAGGAEALEKLDVSLEREEPIDVVLLDLVMHGLDGPGTLREIRKRSHDVKVLVCSGFGASRLAHLPPDLRIDGVLEKPYSLDVLRKTLQDVLAR